MTDAEAARETRRSDPLLAVEDVTAGYGTTTVLNDVSLAVGDGEVVGLVGRNGVGKTTTLRTIMGNLTPRHGHIRIDGVDITAAGPEQTAHHGVALVPEERRVFRSLTVRENLELAALGDSDGQTPRTIDEVLDMFANLAASETDLGGTLSGGEQQMLAIARALVTNARCLLLDEPTEGLAPYIIDQVVDTVAELQAQGVTVLLVEQNVQVALDVCDYVYVMHNGRIVHASASQALRENTAVLNRHLGVDL